MRSPYKYLSALLNIIIVGSASLLTYSASATTSYSCPSIGATSSVVVDSQCFGYFSTAKTWTNAKSACEGISGHLATISGSQENAAVFNLISSTTDSPWLGGSDNGSNVTGASEGEYYWVGDETQFWTGGVSGSPVGGRYTIWHTGEPNDNLGSEDCVGMYYETGHWNDFSCSGSRGYVCQVDAVASTDSSTPSQSTGGLRSQSLQMRIDRAFNSHPAAAASSSSTTSSSSSSSSRNSAAAGMCARLKYATATNAAKKSINARVTKRYGTGCGQ